jgi:hypothetical protein
VDSYTINFDLLASHKAQNQCRAEAHQLVELIQLRSADNRAPLLEEDPRSLEELHKALVVAFAGLKAARAAWNEISRRMNP